MKYNKGDRVKHPKRDDWGLGEVLADSDGGAVRIFFVEAGEKTLSLDIIQPILVAGSEAADPVLDNLKMDKSASGIKYQSLTESIQFFLKEYPEGFYGDKYKADERDYKLDAHDLASELLNKETFHSLLGQKDHTEIRKRALRVINKTNIVFQHEVMALNNGLDDEAVRGDFSISLYNLLYGEGAGLKQRFEAFSDVLGKAGADKWPVISYFLFIRFPDKYMFVKPTIMQHLSDLCRYEINYKPQLNWLTYKRILEFSEHLFKRLSDLKPRDMIDIQSFMWCIAPKSN
ncbi:MAG: DUF3553 domain-containing protein [Gammaproteobacteria bacterium]|nr:DUF3553 domain-containing protein [Gammaproteobacteria bacterium]